MPHLRSDTQPTPPPLNQPLKSPSQPQKRGEKKSVCETAENTSIEKRDCRTPTPEQWQAHAGVIISDVRRGVGCVAMLGFTLGAVETMKRGGYFCGGLLLMGLIPAYLLTVNGKDDDE